MNQETFDRSQLSTREGAILDSAIEGMTDIQIAQHLSISQSTVNSYWVRIRGKLGQLSRTELVALALKSQAQIELASVHSQLTLLREQALVHARISKDYETAEVFHAALDAMPEAMFVNCQAGLIRYANVRLEAMFGYGQGELIDQPVATLLPRTQRERERARIVGYMKDPRPMRMGLSEAVYAQRKDGSLFRVVFLLDSRSTSTGPIAACVVRDFTTEIETRRDFASAAIREVPPHSK